jgi:hypothetical protein
VRVTGFETVVEVDNPTSLLRNIFSELFGQEKLGPMPMINIAHHTRPRHNGSWYIIVQINRFEVKQRIVRFAADYTKKEDQHLPRSECRTETEGKIPATQTNRRCNFIHPAQLILNFKYTAHMFYTAKEAQDFF